jgi:hypothetical protein
MCGGGHNAWRGVRAATPQLKGEPDLPKRRLTTAAARAHSAPPAPSWDSSVYGLNIQPRVNEGLIEDTAYTVPLLHPPAPLK